MTVPVRQEEPGNQSSPEPMRVSPEKVERVEQRSPPPVTLCTNQILPFIYY